MSFPMSTVLAQAAPAGAAPNPFGGSFFFIMIAMFGLMYFMMIRPQQKKQKEHRALLASLAKGDEVVTSGGIAGRVTEVGDAFISVEIAPDVAIKVQKSAVSQVLPKGSLKADGAAGASSELAKAGGERKSDAKR